MTFKETKASAFNAKFPIHQKETAVYHSYIEMMENQLEPALSQKYDA